jgi:hypothetical protein
MGADLMFLEHYYQEGNNFLNQILIVTGDETSISVVGSFSFIIKTHKIETDVVNLKSLSHSFLGPERHPSGGIHVQRSYHQCCVILCNSEVATMRHPKPLVRQAVNRVGSAAQ